MKEIVFVWTQKYCNVEITPTEWRHGLGDLLRGTVGILRYCYERGYECYIDISLHPLSKLLVVTPHKYSEFIQMHKDSVNIFPQHGAVEAIDKELEDKDFTYFFTPFGLSEFDIPATPIIKERIRELMRPNDTLLSYMNPIQIPYPEFVALHFRLGDNELILNEKRRPSEYIPIIESFTQGSYILFSDSQTLKQMAKPYIFTFDSNTAHVGFHTEVEELRSTMLEFFTLRQAKHIFTYSVYTWTSGFVKIINYIYDVPLVNMKI